MPSTLDELAELRQALMAAGHSRAKVAGCVDFVMGRSCGDDMTTGSARAEYRRMLTALVEAHNVHSLALAAA